MNKKPAYNICVVGSGAVGRQIISLLMQRKFPIDRLTILGRTARPLHVDTYDFDIQVASPDSFRGMDIVFFAGTEGSKGASRTYREAAARHGCVVIDNGDDFRMDPDVPLVIPEINPEALDGDPNFIANPNCSTIIMLMPLVPLHKRYGIKRIVASTYQAVSGTGGAAIAELKEQARAYIREQTLPVEVYPYQILFNVIPAIGGFNADGETSEEKKMRQETHKILGDDSIGISTTCVRVPVLNGHSVSLNVEFRCTVPASEARELLAGAPGIRIVDQPEKGEYPMPIHASGSTDVLVGRIRQDWSVKNGLHLFCSGDNLWKGAAQNAIQIAEHLIR